MLDFSDISLKEIPVKVGSTEYILREANGDATCKYRNAAMKNVRLSGGEPSAIGNLADVEPYLVSLCLFTKDGKPVSESTIRSWPAKVVTALYSKAKEISELDQEEETADSLRKKIDEATKKLEELEKDEVGNG